MDSREKHELLETLKARFDRHTCRHTGIAWADVLARIEGDSLALRSLREMELTGGEPDVIGRDGETGRFTFADCSCESPKGRRSICYDRKARVSRKAE